MYIHMYVYIYIPSKILELDINQLGGFNIAVFRTMEHLLAHADMSTTGAGLLVPDFGRVVFWLDLGGLAPR